MKYITYLLVPIIAIIFSGCFDQQPKPIPEPVIVTKVVKVKVPVRCIVPKVTCDFSGKGYEPTVRLLECIVKLKKSIKVCQKP